jgi:glutamine cyclotransferase
MAGSSHPFLDRVFVGSPVEIGTAKDLYGALLMEGEAVDIELKGIRDGAIFTDRRMLVYNRQGITGKKIEFASFAWRAITAFSVENSGTFDLEAECKFTGSGWGVCEIVLTKGTDVVSILRYLNGKVFGD